MVSYEEFEEMASEIVETLPADFFVELSGGVILKEEGKIHPKSIGQELNIMGEYCRSPHLGRYVVIYYGSFVRLYSMLSREVLKERLRKTILHEFRHHLESLAGEKDLEVEDAIQIHQYTNKKMGISENNA